MLLLQQCHNSTEAIQSQVSRFWLGRCTEPQCAGPIQYDAAVDPEIARQKIKTESDVAGQANVCIFPDLNTGNNTYKACPHPFLIEHDAGKACYQCFVTVAEPLSCLHNN